MDQTVTTNFLSKSVEIYSRLIDMDFILYQVRAHIFKNIYMSVKSIRLFYRLKISPV